MDVQSPDHLHRLQAQPDVKVALLRLRPTPQSDEIRFERSPKNSAYWLPVTALDAQITRKGSVDETRECLDIYERPCWLIATALAPLPNSPYVVAIAAADGADINALVKLLQAVCHDYWHGSYFFK